MLANVSLCCCFSSCYLLYSRNWFNFFCRIYRHFNCLNRTLILNSFHLIYYRYFNLSTQTYLQPMFHRLARGLLIAIYLKSNNFIKQISSMLWCNCIICYVSSMFTSNCMCPWLHYIDMLALIQNVNYCYHYKPTAKGLLLWEQSIKKHSVHAYNT